MKKNMAQPDAATTSSGLRIKRTDSYFHPPTAVGGAPKSKFPFLAKVDAQVERIRAALVSKDTVEATTAARLDVFAEDGYWLDPVGGDKNVGTEGLKKFFESLPPITGAVALETFYSMDPNKFIGKNQGELFGGKHIQVNVIETNDDGQFISMESYWNPTIAFEQKRPAFCDKVDAYAQEFAAALAQGTGSKDLLNMFTPDGVWNDPVGGGNYVGTDALKARIAKLPKIEKVEVKEVFYSADANRFLVKYEITFPGKAPFTVLDIVVTEDASVVYYAKDEAIEAKTFQGWEAAKVLQSNGDGTYDVLFDKGTKGSNWRPSNLRKAE